MAMKRGGIALALIGILLVTVIWAPVPGHRRWIGALHNAAHAPIFGCIAVLMWTAIRAHARLALLSPVRQYLLALISTALLGIVTELAQIPTGRDASVSDALNDMLGALAFLLVFCAFDPRLRSARPVRAIAIVAAALLFAIPAAPVVRAAAKYQQRDHRFPVLAEFSHGYDRFFIMQQSSVFKPKRLPEAWASSADESAMHVRFLAGPYPGMDFIEPSPDWSGYSTLAFDVTNPTSKRLELLLRVHDAAHINQLADRFNKLVSVAPSTRVVLRIPLSEIRSGPQTRELDLRHVAGIILFRTDASQAGEMYLSKVWLE